MSTPEVEIWSVDLDRVRGADVLSEPERAKAARFRDPGVGARWAAARTALRQVLAGRLGEGPAAIVFDEGPLGKPQVRGDVRFNISHSGGRALIAVTSGLEVGVDIEQERDVDDLVSVAEIGLPAVDAALVRETPEPAVFLRLWVRHEARLKAIGTGFRTDDARTDVSPESLHVVDLDLGPGYVGAVAVVTDGREPRVVVHEW